MADTYANWAALAAANVEGVDYRIRVRPNRSLNSCIAIHGGGIEGGSTEIASEVAARTRHNFYTMEGLKTSGNSELHITSTNYDEPQAIAMVTKMDYCFSFHGMADVTAGVSETYVGGRDTIYRDATLAALQAAGFTASLGTSELNGDNPLNIVNKTRRSMGVQLELSNAQRRAFFPSGNTDRASREAAGRTDVFYRYAAAIASVANDLGGGALQTPQYQLNLANQTDQMSDFETWLNTNWDKISDAASPPSGTTLPQAGDYNVGDRFYKTDTKSIYILVVKDANWGWHWRPIHDAISPWFTPPGTCKDQAWDWNLNPVATNPFAIAFDNRGKCYWRGVIGPTVGDFSRNSSIPVFKPLPTGLRPAYRGVYMLGHENLSVGVDGTNLNCWQGARILISSHPATSPSVRGFGGTANFNRVHLNVQYAVGSSMYTAP